MEKFPGNFYIGATLTVESLGNGQWLSATEATPMENFPGKFSTRTTLNGVALVDKIREFLHWCKKQFKITKIEFTGAGKKCRDAERPP